jgi:hypothetical protein
MRKTSEGKIRSEEVRGKNKPLAKSAKVVQGQNGEVRPTRRAAREQPGTDESTGDRRTEAP